MGERRGQLPDQRYANREAALKNVRYEKGYENCCEKGSYVMDGPNSITDEFNTIHDWLGSYLE